jgi:hypothetical protein
MPKKSSSVVLASLSSSTYRSVRLRLFARYGLAGRPFEHPTDYSDTITQRIITAACRTETEFFRILLEAWGGIHRRIPLSPWESTPLFRGSVCVVREVYLASQDNRCPRAAEEKIQTSVCARAKMVYLVYLVYFVWVVQPAK